MERLKVCSACRTPKPESEFSKCKTQGRQRICLQCMKDAKLKHRYGINRDEYNEMLSQQDGHCLICESSMDKPNVDHCHTSGLVRGLLCSNCNRALGLFNENTLTLQNAIEYLRHRHGSES